MPVLIMAGIEDLDLVRPLAQRLLQDGGEVRCFLDDDDHELRNMGCKLAVGRLDDAMSIEGAVGGVHTFIPLLPDPARLHDQAALERLLAIAAAASEGGAGVDQTILALPAAGGFDNPLGRAFGEAERIFAAGSRPLCLLRTGFVWGEDRPFTAVVGSLGRGTALPGEGRVAVSVLDREWLVAAVATVDDRESTDGSWELGGRTVPLQELAASAPPAEGPPVSDWLRELLEQGLEVGDSARTALGL